MNPRSTDGQPELREPREGAVFGNRYLLLKKLRSGGMGSVWLAKHTEIDLPCAVKFILCHDDASLPGLRARFKTEARVIASLYGHPNVVQIFDYGIDGGVPYLAMELLSGETLRDRLRREKRLSIQATRKILGDVVAAVSRAHKLGVVHRDLKPANIFLVRTDENETAKILDFGIAKILNESVSSATSKVLGTLTYMSPEQLRNDRPNLDGRTDLWALGIILFECLTGESPYNADNNVGIMSAILLREGPQWNASSRVRNLPPAIDQFFMRAFAHDTRERFQSAAELLSAFDESVRPEPEVSSSARTIQVAPPMPSRSDDTTTTPVANPAAPAARWDEGPHLAPWTPQVSVGETLRLESQDDQASPGDGTEQPTQEHALSLNVLASAASDQSFLASLKMRWQDRGARARAIALGLSLLAGLTGLIAILFIIFFGVTPTRSPQAAEMAEAVPPAQEQPAASVSTPPLSPSASAAPSDPLREERIPDPPFPSAPPSGDVSTPAIPRAPTISPPIAPRGPSLAPAKPIRPGAPPSKQPTQQKPHYIGD